MRESPDAKSVDVPTGSLAGFHEFLTDRYRLIWRFSDQDEVWERKPESAMLGNADYATPTRENPLASTCFPTIVD